ncbi:hypothetical protein HOD20_06905 [archaeon]|nr:hypothetical protein [archaeon]MBT4648677.1 hypothetical protein [archaeon]MBT6821801.1 hypothetical protein [archaeon]MBT7391196.1 hypothetical protein [archaeon]
MKRSLIAVFIVFLVVFSSCSSFPNIWGPETLGVEEAPVAEEIVEVPDDTFEGGGSKPNQKLKQQVTEDEIIDITNSLLDYLGIKDGLYDSVTYDGTEKECIDSDYTYSQIYRVIDQFSFESCSIPPEFERVFIGDYIDLGFSSKKIALNNLYNYIKGLDDSIKKEFYDLDSDGFTNEEECACETDPFYSGVFCQEEAVVEAVPQELPYDYFADLNIKTNCPAVINYALCGEGDCITKETQEFNSDSGGYISCGYASLGKWQKPEECKGDNYAGMSCAKFVASTFKFGISEEEKIFADHLPWGNGYDFHRFQKDEETGMCRILKGRAKPDYMSRVIVDNEKTQLHINEINLDELGVQPGDIFSGEARFFGNGVGQITEYGHVALYIGKGYLSKSGELNTDGGFEDGEYEKRLTQSLNDKYNGINEVFRKKFPRLCFDEFTPNPDGDHIVISSVPPEVCFSTFDGLFGEESPYDLRLTCRAKYCDFDFDTVGNCFTCNTGNADDIQNCKEKYEYNLCSE